MIDQKLTINELKAIAGKLGISLKQKRKADIIKELEEKAEDKEKLQQLCDEFLQAKKKKQGKKKKATSSRRTKVSIETLDLSKSPVIEEMRKKIEQLESQVKYLFSKITYLEENMNTGRDFLSEQRDFESYLSKTKEILFSHIPHGESRTIDEIYSLLEGHSIPSSLIEQILMSLIDEELFDASEGKSLKKINGDIGRLIRR